jgi:hypothetical protein
MADMLILIRDIQASRESWRTRHAALDALSEAMRSKSMEAIARSRDLLERTKELSPMLESAGYRLRAKQCRKQAQSASLHGRPDMLAAATMWEQLADVAENLDRSRKAIHATPNRVDTWQRRQAPSRHRIGGR